MMRSRAFVAAIFVLAIGAGNMALAADPFECPTLPPEEAQAARIAALLPTGDAFENVASLNAAVTTLKSEGVNPGLVIDGVIAAYCPVLAARGGKTDAQKSALMTRFAAQVTRTVYALESADLIILDVAFPPAIVDAINARAKAAGVSPEAWIQSTVTTAAQ